MHDENLHITPDTEKGYPAPEIPADEAWKKMVEILNTEMPVSPPEPAVTPGPPPAAGGGSLGGSSHFWFIALGMLGVVSVLSWGVLRLTNKYEKFDNSKDTIHTVQNSTVIDTLTSTYQNISYSADKIKPSETVDHPDAKQNLPENQPPRENSAQLKATPQAENKTKFEQDPGFTSSLVTDHAADNPTAIVPSQSVIDTITTPVENVPEQKPVNENASQDTIIGPKPQPLPPSPDVDSLKSSDIPLPGETIPNNTWQTGIYGNIGQVFQKGRDDNLFYGGMLTGGLWNKKLKAGIETGLGWEVYHDYGSVLNNIRLKDSIIVDSVVQIKTTDTTRIDKYKYRYQYLQVPLFISKQVLTKGKFSLDIKMGPVIGIMISEQKALDHTLGPEDGEILSMIDDDYSRLKISWQCQVMTQLRWNINDKLSFTLSPSGIFYLNNLYDSKNRPDNTPYGISLYGGLIYKF